MIDCHYKNKKWRRTAKILKLRLSNRRVILGLGISTLDLVGSLFTFGLWQSCSLLTLILRLSSPLAGLFALGHLKLLALVTGLIRPCEGVGREKRGLGRGGLSRGRKSKSRGRREIHWNFSNIFRIKHVLSKSPLEGSRTPARLSASAHTSLQKSLYTSASSSASRV